MAVSSFEGIVENGQIRLLENVTLPEKTRIFVVIPDLESALKAHIYCPRLAHPEQADDFAKQVFEVSSHQWSEQAP